MKMSLRIITVFVVSLGFSACQVKLTPISAPEQIQATIISHPTAETTISPATIPTQILNQSTSISSPQDQAANWWNDVIFYEVFVRSYRDSDGDGVGDINGLIEKLDYLNDGDPTTYSDLGITGIWLMPITQSPSYHGYDVVDYYAVDEEYGTKEDFTRLIDEAHRRGIRVIIDLVLNHTGVDHPWFIKSAQGDPNYQDWYIWKDESPNYPGPWGQNVWYRNGNRFYYAVFWEGMPDLNLENPQVIEEIKTITRFWLEDMNVDGFRMDAIRHFVEEGSIQENTPGTHAWLGQYHKFYKSIDPETFTVGEAWTETGEVIDYIGDEVDIAFEFDLAESFVTAAGSPIAQSLQEQMKIILESYPDGQYGVFLTNHDQNRVMSILRKDERAKLAATMLLTSPGVPFLYYGEEIGMSGVKPDEDIRLPMPWTDENGAGFTSGTPWRPPAQEYKIRNVASQLLDPNSLLNHYRKLIGLRNKYSTLRTGLTRLVDSGSPRLYALLRYSEAEAFLILVNVHPKPLPADRYKLNLDNGPFKGPVTAVSLMGFADPISPQINSSGGFSNYVPFQEIPAESSVIIRLAP